MHIDKPEVVCQALVHTVKAKDPGSLQIATFVEILMSA
jgi:hypothetical protein